MHHPNCTQFLGACTKQKPYIVITELMACSLADAFQKTLFAPSDRRKVSISKSRWSRFNSQVQALLEAAGVNDSVVLKPRCVGKTVQGWQHRFASLLAA